MTPAELELLKVISGEAAKTFLPAGRSAAHAKAFRELVQQLEALKRLGWIELEVAGQSGRVGKSQRTYIAAVARCTEQGRQALGLLGE
jgi:predicted transcriptional regulator